MSNFVGYNSRLTTPSLGTVLTTAMRTGDFSAILPSFALADPNSRAGVFPNITQSYFPGNQIPASRLSKGSATLLKWMPAPNQPAAAGLPFRNYQFASKTNTVLFVPDGNRGFSEIIKSQH